MAEYIQEENKFYTLTMASEHADRSENHQLGMSSKLEGASTDRSTGYSLMYESEKKPALSCEYNHEDITRSANQLIDHLNNKRKQDTELLGDFKKNLEVQVERTCALIEQRLFNVYHNQGKEIQTKIQDLFSCLERIAKLEAELAEFREALRMLYTDMNSAD